jgi:hypothetical protein
MAALQLGWQRGRSSSPPPNGTDGADGVGGPGDPGGAEGASDSPPEAAESDDTTSSAAAKPADGEFRTTPSPKQGSDQEDEGGSE